LRLSPSPSPSPSVRFDTGGGNGVGTPGSDGEQSEAFSPSSRMHKGQALLRSLGADDMSPAEVRYADVEEEVEILAAVDRSDVSGTWDVLTEDGRGHSCSLELVLRQNGRGPDMLRPRRVTGCEGEADSATPFELNGSMDASGSSLTFTQRYTVAPHTIRYWRAEVASDGRTMRGVWATDTEGVAIDGATWKSTRDAPDSIDFAMLSRRGRGVVEFSARRVDTNVGEWSSDEDDGGGGGAALSPRSYSGRERGPQLRRWESSPPPAAAVGTVSVASWDDGDRQIDVPHRSSDVTRLRTRVRYISPDDAHSRSPSSYRRGVAMLDDERQELIDAIGEESDIADDAERRLHRVEQELGAARDALAAAEQRAMVAEEWRKHAEAQQKEAESFLLQANDKSEDAVSEAEEVARELLQHQARIRRAERELAVEQRERMALESDLEQAALREAAMEEAVNSLTNRLGAATEAAASAPWRGSERSWRWAAMGAALALLLAVVASIWGWLPLLALLVLVSYPLLLARALAPGTLNRALTELFSAGLNAPGGVASSSSSFSLLGGTGGTAASWSGDAAAAAAASAGVGSPLRGAHWATPPRLNPSRSSLSSTH